MKQAILILAHKDFAALKKLIAYFKQDCYVFVEVYVGSDNNIPEGYSVQFRLDDFEGNYMETQILKKIPPEGSSNAKSRHSSVCKRQEIQDVHQSLS